MGLGWRPASRLALLTEDQRSRMLDSHGTACWAAIRAASAVGYSREGRPAVALGVGQVSVPEILRACLGSRSASSSIEPFRSAKRTVTCFRSPSRAALEWGCVLRGARGCRSPGKQTSPQLSLVAAARHTRRITSETASLVRHTLDRGLRGGLRIRRRSSGVVESEVFPQFQVRPDPAAGAILSSGIPREWRAT